MSAAAIIRAGTPLPCRPGRRFLLSADAWRSMAGQLAAAPELGFLALWADAQEVHALFWHGEPLLASAPVEAGLYAALSRGRPAASLFERQVGDLWGHEAAEAADTRPWLDHGAWQVLRPLSERPVPNNGVPEAPEMRLPPEGNDQLGFGPLPPLPAPGPAHWRVAVSGPTVRALEARLGYGHRGVAALMRGKSVNGAARLAARIDGAATVAHSLAYARAAEAASEAEPPPRAIGLRAAMAATERVSVALHHLAEGADACGSPAAARFRAARADLLAACAAAFGHRLMLDLVRPGGVAAEPGGTELAVLDAALEAAAEPVLRPIAGWPASGTLPIAAALRLGVPGTAGRASGRPDPDHPAAPLEADGTAAARFRLMLAGVAADAASARRHLADLPGGSTLGPVPHASAEGLGRANGPGGTVWHWVRLAGGIISASFAADPAVLLLPGLAAAAPGAPLAVLPTLSASFGLRLPGIEQ